MVTGETTIDGAPWRTRATRQLNHTLPTALIPVSNFDWVALKERLLAEHEHTHEGRVCKTALETPFARI